MTNTLTLATRLRTMSDDDLATIISTREISANNVKDFFDLAEALLEKDSIQKVLTRLERSTLATLAALADLTSDGDRYADAEATASRLREWGDVSSTTPPIAVERLSRADELLLSERSGDRFALYDAVRAQLESWPQVGLPDGRALAATPAPAALLPVPETELRFTDRLASEHAFGAVNRVSELIAELGRESARELQKGGLALPASKRIAAALSVGLAEVPAIVSVAARADLIALDAGSWLSTDAGAEWQLQPTTDRWCSLASAWHRALPPDIRGVLADRAHAAWGDALREFVQWRYPAGGAWMQRRIEEYVEDAEVLGITARHAPSTPGTLLLESGPEAAAQAVSALFPPEVTQVYLQHDLSIVSPGPLAPAIDARLRTLADVESRALASTYRVSAASLNRAVGTGETAHSLRAFLSEISLTGIPQPLDYLITEAASRYGRVRVAEAGNEPFEAGHAGARSSVHSDDRQLLRTIEVDQSLASLGLVRTDPNRLASRFPRDVVFWALSDARYPVAAEDASGTPISLKRARTAQPRHVVRAEPAADIVSRLRLGGEPDEAETSDAWMARQLDIAIKTRVPLRVSVAMPDGKIVDYELEPTGVGGGRLRGRDRGADIERTLPVSSIRSLGPIE